MLRNRGKLGTVVEQRHLSVYHDPSVGGDAKSISVDRPQVSCGRLPCDHGFRQPLPARRPHAMVPPTTARPPAYPLPLGIRVVLREPRLPQPVPFPIVSMKVVIIRRYHTKHRRLYQCLLEFLLLLFLILLSRRHRFSLATVVITWLSSVFVFVSVFVVIVSLASVDFSLFSFVSDRASPTSPFYRRLSVVVLDYTDIFYITRSSYPIAVAKSRRHDSLIQEEANASRAGRRRTFVECARTCFASVDESIASPSTHKPFFFVFLYFPIITGIRKSWLCWY